MRLLIDDGMQIRIGTGIGKYTSYLVSELKKCQEQGDTIELNTFNSKKSSPMFRRIKYLLYINSLRFMKKCKSYDIVHFTNFAIPFFRTKGVKYITTIHDLSSFKYPETFSHLFAFYSRFMINYAIKHADLVLTVSESSRKELQELWPQCTEKIKFVYPGLYFEYNRTNNQRNFALKEINDCPYFLFVGTIEKRKNLGIVIEAFKKLKDRGRVKNYKLILAGRDGYGAEVYRDTISRFGLEEDVILTGYIESNDISKLYDEADAYIFPTVYEGFGSTQLECMAHGLPIILSDIPTNREISKDYGLFFDLEDINTLTIQMEKIIGGEVDRKESEKKAKKKLKRYQWSNLIRTYMSIYKGVLR